MSKETITMLGTGEAVTTKCYNTCFTIRTPSSTLLVDGGGGNGILVQLEKAGIGINEIDAMFVTHTHTDHILGAVWVVRMVLYRWNGKEKFPVYGNNEVIFALQSILAITLNPKDIKLTDEKVDFHILQDGDIFDVGDIHCQSFDIHSPKSKQFGFRATLPSGKIITCLGDEPFNPLNKDIVDNSDWLMHEAFCLYADRERFQPYKKHHSTAWDAGKDAAKLNVKNLILYHTEDTDLENRKAKYTAEAESVYKGKVFVPDDLETITIN